MNEENNVIAKELIQIGNNLDCFETHFEIAKQMWTNTEIHLDLILDHLVKGRGYYLDAIELLKKKIEEEKNDNTNA